ncbi:MAG: hypothetical protein J6Y42_02185 [Bacilli bacterium]|nr:hypothetical protein [Bacilli bacterium]
MVLTIIISLLVFILLTLSIIFFPSIKIRRIRIATYWVIAFIGAILLIIFRCVPFNVIINNLTVDTSINPIKILVLFLSMTFISIVLDELGLFKWASIKAVKIAKNKQLSIFLSFYFLTAILTIFTSNDIVVLTLTPFICFFCKNTKVNPIPYLIGEFVASNTYSMMLLIGNPTNIYLASAQSISFIDYIKVMLLPTIAAGILELVIILLLFNKSLKKPIEKVYENIEIKNKAEVIISGLHLVVCLIFLIISSYINVQMHLVSLFTALSLIICLIIFKIIRKKDYTLTRSIRRIPFELVPFVLSMFVIIISLDYQNVTEKLGQVLSNGNSIFVYGISSFLSANIINNIPMSMLFSHLITLGNESEIIRATYAAIIGSNIGAFLTPIGALAGIMFTSLTEIYDAKINFKTFIKYGIIISIPVILISLLMLEIVL